MVPDSEHALAGIDSAAVARWLAGHVGGLVPPVDFALVAGGRSNLTYRLTDAAGAVYVLRRPPTDGVLTTAHDMSREWRFISALAPTAVPVAAPLAYCADVVITGAEFYVMEYINRADNVIPLVRKPAVQANPAIAAVLNYVSLQLSQSQLEDLDVQAAVPRPDLQAIAKAWVLANLGRSRSCSGTGTGTRPSRPCPTFREISGRG